jgi:tyrosine-protein phosphatase YwqE
MAWVELHSHLLPGVDDGPRSVEESVALAVAAVSEGTGTLVATPHVNPDESFTAAAEELRDRGFAVVVAHPERVQPTGGAAAVLQHDRLRRARAGPDTRNVSGTRGAACRRAPRSSPVGGVLSPSLA